MRLEELEVVLTDHAYTRHCERVGEIDRQQLTEHIQAAVSNGHSLLDKEGYLKVCNAWYMSQRTEGVLRLITCFGNTHMDLPAAKRWERVNNDRINYGGDRYEMVDSLYSLLGTQGSAVPT